MKKMIVPLALAFAVAASGAAFAKTQHTAINTDPNGMSVQHVSADSLSMASTSYRNGMTSQNGKKIVWKKKHHNTFYSENGLFGPYGPE